MNRLILASLLLAAPAFAQASPKPPTKHAVAKLIPPSPPKPAPDSTVLTLTLGDLKSLMALQSAQAQAQVIARQAQGAQQKLQNELKAATK